MKSKKKSDKSSKSQQLKIDENAPDKIKEKLYITQEIDTSITLLESPEDNLILESLLFLSKYGDLKRNNLVYIHSRGLLPKLLALLEHNICIVRLSLRLLSELLRVEAAQVELNHEKFDETIMKISEFYKKHPDKHIKEFSIAILATYSMMGKAQLLLQKPEILSIILKNVKNPESETILNNSLKLFSKFIELETVRQQLPDEKDFNLQLFVQHMEKSESCFATILNIFEKMTYFGEDILQNKLKECNLVEHILTIIVNPEKKSSVPTCLNIVKHCMANENTNSYFTTSLEFLKFCEWVKTCKSEFLASCALIFLELSKINSIRQMLFDLSVEDAILSFLRSEDMQVLNVIFESIAFMSKHKYCCEKMLTPIVIKKLLEAMQRGDEETALSTLHYFARRDTRTIHMIRAYNGVAILLDFLQAEKLSPNSFRKILEISNMFVTNNQLQRFLLTEDFYKVILTQSLSKFDEICMRSLEIMINCLNHKDFQNYFLLNKGAEIVAEKLSATRNEEIVRLLTIFIHNALMFEALGKAFIHRKILIILKNLSDGIKFKNPLIHRVINLIYDMCLPLKFFETGKLALTDCIKERFYVLHGPWTGPFPFLEVLELKKMSTLSTIYVVDECEMPQHDDKTHDCFSIQKQNRLNSSSYSDLSTISVSYKRCSINFGSLSHDPYLPKYIHKVRKLLLNKTNLEEKIKIVAEFVERCLCGPEKDPTNHDKLHTFKLHLECIKMKLGTNMIPIGYLRLGFHCERALLFKALADHVYIPVTLVRGRNKLYWNEVALIQNTERRSCLKLFVVDLMFYVGRLLPVGSKECNMYCDIQ